MAEAVLHLGHAAARSQSTRKSTDFTPKHILKVTWVTSSVWGANDWLIWQREQTKIPSATLTLQCRVMAEAVLRLGHAAARPQSTQKSIDSTPKRYISHTSCLPAPPPGSYMSDPTATRSSNQYCDGLGYMDNSTHPSVSRHG
jgi:hypothetical protein